MLAKSILVCNSDHYCSVVIDTWNSFMNCQPGKSLYTTVRELVENSLDSSESISELPVVEVTM